MSEIIRRTGMKFIKECSGDSTQLIQSDGKVYGITLVKGMPVSVEDLTELVKGKNGHEPIQF